MLCCCQRCWGGLVVGGGGCGQHAVQGYGPPLEPSGAVVVARAEVLADAAEAADEPIAIPWKDAPALALEELGPTLGVNAYRLLPELGDDPSGWSLPLWFRDEQKQLHFRVVDLSSGAVRDGYKDVAAYEVWTQQIRGTCLYMGLNTPPGLLIYDKSTDKLRDLGNPFKACSGVLVMALGQDGTVAMGGLGCSAPDANPRFVDYVAAKLNLPAQDIIGAYLGGDGKIWMVTNAYRYVSGLALASYDPKSGAIELWNDGGKFAHLRISWVAGVSKPDAHPRILITARERRHGARDARVPGHHHRHSRHPGSTRPRWRWRPWARSERTATSRPSSSSARTSTWAARHACAGCATSCRRQGASRGGRRTGTFWINDGRASFDSFTAVMPPGFGGHGIVPRLQPRWRTRSRGSERRPALESLGLRAGPACPLDGLRASAGDHPAVPRARARTSAPRIPVAWQAWSTTRPRSSRSAPPWSPGPRPTRSGTCARPPSG